MDYHLIAVQVGDRLKYSTTLNEIDRIAGSLFPFQRANFPNQSITSSRAQLIYDWILSLARREMAPNDRDHLLIKFCHSLATDDVERKDIDKILINAGISREAIHREDYTLFLMREFHPEIIRHCKELFLQGNYFHAVFEACKAYNASVQQKARSEKSGVPLMLEAWGCDKGVLKVTPCKTETDRDVQDGLKFLSAGLMRAIRNPTAHEPAILWPISKQDCLDILGLVSFLFRQLDMAVYYDPSSCP